MGPAMTVDLRREAGRVLAAAVTPDTFPARRVAERLVAACDEIDRLRALNVALAERVAAASEVLSKAAERRPDLFPERDR